MPTENLPAPPGEPVAAAGALIPEAAIVEKHFCSPEKTGCELQSFCASHVAALLILTTSLAVFLANYPTEPKTEAVFQVQATFLLIILILWYFFGALNIEEKFVGQLRGLTGRCARFEFLLRVLVFVFLEMSEVGLASRWFRPPGTKETVFTLAALYFITFCFMGWDFIVDLGGRTDIAWDFFKYDAVLALSTFTCLVAALTESQWVCAITMALTAGVSGIVIALKFSVVRSIARRLRSRATLR